MIKLKRFTEREVTVHDKLKLAKIATKNAAQNIRYSTFGPKKFKVMKKGAVVKGDKVIIPAKWEEKDNTVKERLRGLKDGIKSVPMMYKGGLKDYKEWKDSPAEYWKAMGVK